MNPPPFLGGQGRSADDVRSSGTAILVTATIVAVVILALVLRGVLR